VLASSIIQLSDSGATPLHKIETKELQSKFLGFATSVLNQAAWCIARLWFGLHTLHLSTVLRKPRRNTYEKNRTNVKNNEQMNNVEKYQKRSQEYLLSPIPSRSHAESSLMMP